MLASRYAYAMDLFLVAVLGVTTLAVAPRKRCHHHRQQRPLVITVMPAAPERIGHLEPSAGDYYADRKYELAAAVADGEDKQLYLQLARAWDRAFASGATPETRFEALRYARRLDLVFGGRFADELDGYLRVVAPLAVVEYAHAHNREGLELALTTCDALGVAVDRKNF